MEEDSGLYVRRMHILCDTSSILLLIRIAPEMFIDDRYECCTLHEIYDELFRSQKFKQKYPWRDKFKNKIKYLDSQKNIPDVALYYNIIVRLNETGIKSNYSGKIFSLSRVDMKLLAYSLAHEFKLSTGDQGIKEFTWQEFSEEFKGDVSALEIINLWLRKKLVVWNDELHEYVADWNRQNEHPQPKEHKKIFEKLTGRKYPGS
jgi:hypothetical protein